LPRKKEPQPCLCECGEKTLGGRFRPGHDAKLKSRLVEAAKAPGVRVRGKARARLEELGWGRFIPAED
jgi:hypothetical protein